MKTIDKPVKKKKVTESLPKEPKLVENLKFVRIFDPIHIPKYLVEQIKQRDYEVDDFYKLQSEANLITDKDGIKLNPYNHLYVLVNKDNVTKGFVWFSVDPLTKSIFINNFSMDKEYWHNGKAIEQLKDFIVNIMKKAKLKQVLWLTNYPRHFEKYGFKRSKGIIMEYDNG